MTKCECVDGCPFFNDRMNNMPRLAEQYKKNYCLGNFENCARYKVFKNLDKDRVPSDLFPNQHEKAEKILS